MSEKGKNKFIKGYTGVEGGIAFFCSVIFCLIVSIVFSIITEGAEKGTGYYIGNFFAKLAISVFFLIAACVSARLLGSRITYKPVRIRPVAMLVALLISVICIIGYEGLALLFVGLLSKAGYSGAASLEYPSVGIWIIMGVQAIIIAPICEEMLFRGAVLSSLAVMTEKSHNARRLIITIVLCGAAFMLMHMSPVQTVYQFFFGAALAYVTIKFGSILPAIIMHIFNNLIGYVLCIPVIDKGISSLIMGVVDSGWGIAIYLPVCLLLGVGATFAIIKLCRHFGGKQLPYQEKARPGSDFKNFADDGGTVLGGMFFILGAIICIVVWISALAAGFA